MQETVLLETFYGFFVPVAIATLAFFFAYLLLPAARVKIFPALCGAVFAGICWEIARSTLSYVVPRAASFSVYGSLLAIAVVFLWFHISWSVLLFGAQLSFVIQCPREAAALLASRGADPRLPPGFLALAVAIEVAKAVTRGAPPPPLEDLAEGWSVKEDLILHEVIALTPAVFHRGAGDDDVYYLTGDTDRILVRDLLGPAQVPATPPFESGETAEFLTKLKADLAKGLNDLTVRDVLNRNFSVR
jgi:membrane protein